MSEAQKFYGRGFSFPYPSKISLSRSVSCNVKMRNEDSQLLNKSQGAVSTDLGSLTAAKKQA